MYSRSGAYGSANIRSLSIGEYFSAPPIRPFRLGIRTASPTRLCQLSEASLVPLLTGPDHADWRT